MRGILLEPDEVLEYWPILDGYVKQFLAHDGESTPFSIAQNLINGHYHAWLVVDEENQVKGAAVTKIDEWPMGRYLHIIGTAGVDFKEWQWLHTACIEKMARAAECEAITFWGRKGWEKIFKDYKGAYGEKYRPVHTIYQMDLREPINYKEDLWEEAEGAEAPQQLQH